MFLNAMECDWPTATYRLTAFYYRRKRNPLPAKAAKESFPRSLRRALVVSLYTAMSASLPGSRDLPVSQYDLTTYWGRVRHAADISDPR